MCYYHYSLIDETILIELYTVAVVENVHKGGYSPIQTSSREIMNSAKQDLSFGDLTHNSSFSHHLFRLEQNWEDPETFKPERFMSDIQPYHHLPFITGPQMCIGHKFATFEMKIVLASLLRDFEFSLVPGFKFKRVQALSVKPHPDLVLNVCKI